MLVRLSVEPTSLRRYKFVKVCVTPVCVYVTDAVSGLVSEVATYSDQRVSDPDTTASSHTQYWVDADIAVDPLYPPTSRPIAPLTIIADPTSAEDVLNVKNASLFAPAIDPTTINLVLLYSVVVPVNVGDCRRA